MTNKNDNTNWQEQQKTKFDQVSWQDLFTRDLFANEAEAQNFPTTKQKSEHIWKIVKQETVKGHQYESQSCSLERVLLTRCCQEQVFPYFSCQLVKKNLGRCLAIVQQGVKEKQVKWMAEKVTPELEKPIIPRDEI